MADPTDPPLSPAQRSKIRRLSQAHEPAPGEEAGELNIVPYLDIIINILVFVLVSVSVTFVATIDTQPPAIGGGKVRADVSSKALNLSAFVTRKGISLKTSSGNIAPGCKNVGSGVTVSMVANEKGEDVHDYEAVTSCAKELKNARPEFGEEVQVTITASPDIPYSTIIKTMDALRSDGEQELFPEVFFAVTK